MTKIQNYMLLYSRLNVFNQHYNLTSNERRGMYCAIDVRLFIDQVTNS